MQTRHANNVGDNNIGDVTGFSIDYATRDDIMAAFDALPFGCREILRQAPLPYSPLDLLSFVRECGPQQAIRACIDIIENHFPGFRPLRSRCGRRA